MVFVWIMFVLYPLVDEALPHDHFCPSNPKLVKQLSKDRRYLIPLYFAYVTDLAVYCFALNLAGSGQLKTGRFLMLALITSMFASVSAVVGHELFHRKEKVHKVMGFLSYTKFFASHTYTSHVKFHHKRVGTFEDATTPRLGETLVVYIIRQLIESTLEVWSYEYKHQKATTDGGLRLPNELIPEALLHFAMIGIIMHGFGPLGALFTVIYALLSIIQLETVNYIEHYGLMRKKDKDGVYEPINIRHSWNAP
jgi:alkane 1-monooxygenase